MKITIIVYLSLGLLSIFFGPIAKEINPTIQIPKLIPRNIVEIIKLLTLRLIVIIIFPILYLAFLIDCFRSSKNSTNETPIDYDNLENDYFNNPDNFLFYFGLGGTGLFHCNECGFKEKIVSFLHNFGPDSWTNTGYQCQSCGKFHQIERDSENSKGKLCECGGNLSRGNPLFCPKCKSKKLRYYLEYIT